MNGFSDQPLESLGESLFDPLFNWLLSSDDEPTLPADFGKALESGRITESELLAAYAFAQLAAIIDPKLRPKIDLLREAGDVPDDFLPFQNTPQADLLAKVRNPLDLLKSTPPEISSAVADIVIAFKLKKRIQPKIRLKGLHPPSFQHPVDRALLGTINKIPGLNDVISTIVGPQSGNAEVSLAGKGILVRPSGSLASLHACFQEACDVLEIHPIPHLYIEQGAIGTRNIGLNTPSVVVSSATLSFLTRDELLFALGHELGHIKAGHIRYQAVVDVLRNSGDLMADFTFGLSKLVESATVTPLLSSWVRRSELTADRAGFLVCQDRDVALRTLAKLAGFPPSLYRQLHSAAIVEQVEEFGRFMEQSLSNRFYKLNQLWNALQPFPVIRAYELLEWLQDGVAQELLDMTPAQREQIHLWATDDPALADFIDVLIRVLSRWAGERLRLSPKLCRRVLRSVLLEKQSAKETPLSRIMQIAISAKKLNAETVSFSAQMLLYENGKAFRITVPIVERLPWDEVPQQYREEFIRGGTPEVEYMLYTV
jgi:hypothetical protein